MALTRIQTAALQSSITGSNITDGSILAADLITTSDFTFYGVKVGRGAGALSSNTVVGASGLNSITTGTSNTAVGYQAAYANTTGTGLVAFGLSALAANTTGNGNAAFGQAALLVNTTGSENTAIGSAYATYAPLRFNTTGSLNVAVGSGALAYNTTAGRNVGIGYQAGYNNDSGQFNVLMGYQAGYRSAGTGSIGDASVFIGYQSGYSNQGNNNVAIGNGPLFSNTTGTFNVAIGQGASYDSTTGAYNTALGAQAGYGTTTGVSNTVLGYQAGYTLLTSSYNVYVGQGAGYSATGADGRNTFIGMNAGQTVSTGIRNTIVGRFNGNESGLDIRTSSNNIVLADGSGVPKFQIDNNGTTKFANAPSNRSEARAAFQIAQGVLTSAASGVAKSFAYVGHHHCIRIYISVGGPNNSCSGGTWMGRSLFTCGSGATTQEQTQVYYSGSETNLSSISVNYLNGGGTTSGYANYTLTITNTFTGTTPLIWYTIEGIANVTIVPFQDA
jgi:hypothetical protein